MSLSKERERLRKVMICSLVESEILDFGKAEVIMDQCFEKIKKQDSDIKKELKVELKQQNKLWGMALLERKDTGKTIEHCFDGFFRNMDEKIDEVFDDAIVEKGEENGN